MSWYCPNSQCPYTEKLKKNLRCPVCTRKVEKFGGFFGHPKSKIKDLLDDKNLNISIHPIKKCDCENGWRRSLLAK